MALPIGHSIRITADEINCLIYAYLIDSGFTHSAFAIKAEGQLDRSPYASKHIPRGELIELLSKSLLYIEVESHWRKGGSLTTNCKSGFSLLEPHVCSLELSDESVDKTDQSDKLEEVAVSTSRLSNLAITADIPKRKESPTAALVEGPIEKRAKKDPDSMDLDTPTEAPRPKVSPTDVSKSSSAASELLLKNSSESLTKKPAAKLKPSRPQGPDDDVTNPRAVLLLPGHKTEVFVCAWNPVNHDILATGSKDAIVNIWNLPKFPESLESFPMPVQPTVIDSFSKPEQSDLTSLHWNLDGTLVAVGSYDSQLRLLASDGSIYFSHPQHQLPIFAAKFSKSGKWLLTASLDCTACLWDVKGRQLHRQYRCHSDCCLDVDWLDDETFATCGADHVIYILRVDATQPLKRLTGHSNEINQIKCNSFGTRLASCSDDMTARIWNVTNLENGEDIPGLVASDAVVVLQGHTHSVSTLNWCSDQSIGPHPLIATSSFDGTARLWDSVTGDCLKIFTDHKRPVYTLAFSPNGHWLATGSGDGWLHIYHVLSQEKRWSWFAGSERPGVFEIDWQVADDVNRIALALECRQVAVVDVKKVPALQDDPPRRTGTKAMYAT